MDVLLPLLLGIGISFVGAALPGLLNITAVKVAINDGRTRALIYSLGAVAIIFFQIYIAVSFAQLISGNPAIISLLQEIGTVIFTLLTIYFLFLAKKPVPKEAEDEIVVKSKRGRFFLGALLSALNFFPVPFYVVASITLSTYGLFFFEPLFVFLFVIGVTAGSYFVLYLYIVFFKKIEHKTDFMMRNINKIIGGITGVIAVITFIRIINNL